MEMLQLCLVVQNQFTVGETPFSRGPQNQNIGGGLDGVHEKYVYDDMYANNYNV